MNFSLSRNLAAWQVTHKQLLRSDAQYQKRFHVYLAGIALLSAVLLIFYLPFFGVRLFMPPLDLAMILGLALVIVALTLRQFHYQRTRIRHYLESAHDA